MNRFMLGWIAGSILLTNARGIDDAAQSNNAFCFQLLDQIAAQPGNQVVSPFSIWSALAMTSAGAEGETLQQMLQVLNLPGANPYRSVSEWSTALQNVNGVQMKVANRLWGKQGLPFKPPFLKLANEQFGAGLQTLDFGGNPEGSCRKINSWVAEHTNGRIKGLLSPSHLDDDTRLVLTNAVYFQGKWNSPFHAEDTQRRDFKLASGDVVQPETMWKEFATGYMDNRQLQAIRLKYEGEQMAMIVVLPRKRNALSKTSAFIDAKQFAGILGDMKEEDSVIVQIPKFEASARVELAPDILGTLGMTRAFMDVAEFGRMCAKPIKISNVIHQAWIKVEEKGTEAAAATAVVAKVATAVTKPVKPKEFIADHPFLFFIIDERNGGIVFAGRMMDPR